MRDNACRAVIILWLPLQVLCVGIKLEGLIDLGPKWGYVYKLTPIKTDDSKENDETTVKNDLNILRINKKVKERKTDLNTDRNVDESVEKMIQVASQENNNDSVTEENDKSAYISDESTNESNSEDTSPKYTKQYISSRTYMPDDDGKQDNDKLTTYDGSITDKRHKTNRNVSGSLLRIKNKKDEKKIKYNAKIKEFTVHVFNQSLDIFDKMKRSTDDERIKRKIKDLRYSFIDKFSDFLKDTSEYQLKTKLANQNVVLHTIDVNNYLLKRIVNYLSDDNDGNTVRMSSIINIFKNEVEKVRNIENKHACAKLSICRSDEEYSDFIKDILDIILLTDNHKLKQASDALTETIKTSDFSNILDSETVDKLNKLMTNIETWNPFLTRSMFLMLRSVLAYKNLPIIIMARVSERDAVNKTISVHNLIHLLNTHMGTVENKNEWKEMKKRIEEWRDGKRNDVQTTIELIVRQVINVFEKADVEIRRTVNDLMKDLLSWR